MMYVHSYQSYLWNHAASIRVQKYGVGQVVPGDLVFCDESPQGNIAFFDNSEPEEGDCDDAHGLPDISVEVLPEEKARYVKTVNDEDLGAGGYAFEDVVLPLPGSRILYPANDIADIYHDIAKKDGINLTESVHSAKEFSITRMTGDYRRVFQRPTDFAWELLTYTDSNVSLSETDLDIMSKSGAADVAKEEGDIDGKSGSSVTSDYGVKDGGLSNNESAYEPDAESRKLALKLGFTLPASCYATMAVRELLKASTSVAYQKTMNQ